MIAVVTCARILRTTPLVEGEWGGKEAMPTPIARADARGKIIRKDERDDGTEIWLVCEEADGPTSTGVETDDPDEWYPMPALTVAESPALVVDTTELRKGELQFSLPRFVARALQLLDEGESEVALNDENAHEWGATQAGTDTRSVLI